MYINYFYDFCFLTFLNFAYIIASSFLEANMMCSGKRLLLSAMFFLLALFFGPSVAQGQTKPVPADKPAGGVVSVCTTVDDDWKCVGEAKEWEANKKFDVLFINPVKVGVDFVGIIFHKQLPDGKDGDFLYEFQQNMGADNRKYCTTGTPFYLPAGTYTIYIISWTRRDTLFKKGNYADYFAKTTLKVK